MQIFGHKNIRKLGKSKKRFPGIAGHRYTEGEAMQGQRTILPRGCWD